MPRAKIIWTEEMKAKAKATRLANALARKNKVEPTGKPILRYSGYEEDGFDFWPSIRNALRPLHKYTLCQEIERKIVDPAWWKNINKILDILSEYFILEKADGKPKKKRAPRVFTDEQRKAIGERLKKARMKNVEAPTKEEV